MSKGITWRDAPAGGPWHFPGIPGVYATGVVVSLESTGRSEEEMQAIIAAHPDLSLEIIEQETTNEETPVTDAEAPPMSPRKKKGA